MHAAFTGTLREHRTAQEWAEGIEAATWISNDPAMTEPTGILRLLLGLHQKNHGTEFVATGAQPVPMPSLHHQKTSGTHQKPTTWMGWVFHLQSVNRLLAAELTNLDQHNSDLLDDGGQTQRKPPDHQQDHHEERHHLRNINRGERQLDQELGANKSHGQITG